MPACEGDGTQRYRKPCKAYDLALKHGCDWDLRMGDLSFAEPPDCYELPVREYQVLIPWKSSHCMAIFRGASS